ncbi:carbon storage regulator [Halorhodospira halophila]|nr:hypothetical protein [Halorhodospira halophila]
MSWRLAHGAARFRVAGTGRVIGGAWMLILQRRLNESVRIGDEIEVQVLM